MIGDSILFKSIIIYLVYVFVFAIVIFFVQKPKLFKEEEHTDLKDDFKTNNDRAALIETGLDGILVRLNLIHNAKKTIDISYYTLQLDDSTRILLGSIIDAADRGVKVRILLDGIFYNLKKDLKSVLYTFYNHPNIELKLYEPFKLFKPRTWNDRLHDKLILVDSELALIGGRNIGDKYFIKENKLNSFSKDRDVIIFDDKADDNTSLIKIQKYYNKVFDYKYSETPIKNLSKRKINRGKQTHKLLKDIFINYINAHPSNIKEIDWYKKTRKTNGVEFVYNPIGRGNQDPWVLRKLLKLAKDAKESILFQSPYVILTDDIVNHLKSYKLDTSKITMLTNSLASSPNLIAIAGYSNSKKEIIDSGVKVYEYQGPQSIHGKSYIYDNKICAIGSFNFDARSSYINSEIMVIIHSEEFTSQLKAKVNIDINNSLKVLEDYNYKESDRVAIKEVSKLKRIVVKILSKIVYFLDYLL